MDANRISVASIDSGLRDARLIAAAPDLLAALRGLIAPGDGGVYATKAVIDAGRAAIAKATGGAA